MNFELITKLIEANKAPFALSSLRSLLDHDPSQRTIQFALNCADKLKKYNSLHFTPVPISLLSNFTLSPLIPYLKAFAYANQLEVVPYLGPFNQIHQEILNPDEVGI